MDASSSSSSFPPVSAKEYGVFLSFRGDDTRSNFVCHLHDALRRHGFFPFVDNDLERGKNIETILKKIERSYMSIIIFSRDFASSSFCLDEVVKILQCEENDRQIVVPVFYHVNPADVQSQNGTFQSSFAKHEEELGENSDKVKEWRTSLSTAAGKTGVVWTDSSRLDTELIQRIVDVVSENLNPYLYDPGHLVGIESQVQQLESLLNIGGNGVRKVGIWGMGGIGKTAIAMFIFNKFSSEFESTCFLENVREESERRGGLNQLEKELFSDLFHGKNVNPRSLERKKVLVVLDDVDKYEQIRKLAGENKRFGGGSRVLITSRDKGEFKDGVGEIYEVKALSSNEALRLFRSLAFKGHDPSEDYLRLSERAVDYAQGNPLALTVLGQFLHGRSEKEWLSAFDKLTQIPDRKVQAVLRISYDRLDDHEQKVFLYIACVFKGDDRSRVDEVLGACGFSITIILTVLAERALIKITNDKVNMHDLLRDMGRDIVRQECIKEPGNRSMLWDHEDVCDVLQNNTGTRNVDAISLDLIEIERLHESVPIRHEAFVAMNRIKYLQIRHSHGWFPDCYWRQMCASYPGIVYSDEPLKSLPNELRYLKWDFYPWKSLPPNFNPKKLVEIHIYCSEIEQLWTGVQDLPNLKVCRFRFCEQLIEMPDFSMAPKLKIIDFKYCLSLREVSPSISLLRNLEILELSFCEKIKCVPSTRDATSLRRLHLCGCKMVNKFPEVSESITGLDLSYTAISEIPPFENFTQLEYLFIYKYERLGNLLSDIFQLQSLRELRISGSYANISCIENVWGLHSLRKLEPDREITVSISENFKQLSRLEKLDIVRAWGSMFLAFDPRYIWMTLESWANFL